MKWYHYIVPAIAIYNFVGENYWAGVALLLGFPMFWLHQLIEDHFGGDPDRDSYLVSLELYNKSVSTTPPPLTKHQKNLNRLTVACWVSLFVISVYWK